MGDLTFIVKIENINSNLLECCFMGLVSQSSISFKIIMSKIELSNENQKHLKFLQNFCSVEFYEGSLKQVLEKVQTKYVSFIDYHDILYPHFAYSLVYELDRSPNRNFIYGTSFLCKVNADGIIKSKIRYKGEKFKFRKNNVYLNSCVFNTEFLKKIRFTPSSLFIIRCALKSKPLYLERDLSERWIAH